MGDCSSFLWLRVSPLAGKVNLVRKVTPDLKGKPDLQDHQGKLGLLDHQGLRVNQGLRVKQGLRVNPVLRANKDRRDRRL